MRQINLLPEHMQKDQNQKVILNSTLIAFGGALLISLVIHGLLAAGIAKLKEQISKPASYMDTVEFVQLRDQRYAAEERVKKYVNQHGALIESYVDNRSTVDILFILGQSSKHKVWVTKFSLNNTKRDCQIEGRSFSTRLVSEFMLNIKKSSLFDNVSLISIEKGTDEKVDFKIACTLK